MEVLSRRLLLRPTDPERSRVFYRDTLGLAIYREFGSGPDRGTVFFLGGGFLELSGRAEEPPAPGVALWLQVRELAAVARPRVLVCRGWSHWLQGHQGAARRAWRRTRQPQVGSDGCDLAFVAAG
jgi:catechol 2,3-dioxygenase-like lactoylglutathione lyase family enzyme